MQFETVGDSRVPAPSSDPEVADGQILALRHQAPDLCVTSAQVCKAVECFKVRGMTVCALCVTHLVHPAFFWCTAGPTGTCLC